METATQETPFVMGFTEAAFGTDTLGVVTHDLSNAVDLTAELGAQGIDIIPYDQFFTDGEVLPDGRKE